MQPQPYPHPQSSSFPTARPVRAGARLYREPSDQPPATGSGSDTASGDGQQDAGTPPAPTSTHPGTPGQEPGDQPSAWGSQWSRRQPPRRQGGWGGRPGNDHGGGPWGEGPQGGGPSGQAPWGAGPQSGGSGQSPWAGPEQGGEPSDRRPDPNQGGPGPSGQGPWGGPPEQGPWGGGGDRRPDAGGPGGPGGLRWDPTDPNQRRARYALLAGVWAFFFAILTFWQLALLLGALSVYWGISSLRNKAPRPEGAPVPAGSTASGSAQRQPAVDAFGRPVQSDAARPQTTAAVVGIVAGGLALAIVAALFTLQMVYRDYFTCVDDALTQASREACAPLLPEPLHPVFGVDEKDGS
ncbi:hypothetical protein AB0M28_30670 [Streptomyces sp. NPDC051940]|uniref:hypothetical protein n=1 Tax=Streptomyces sp. NPDC051940 TaxID=3155675 RepID=UPI003437165C